jgi:hypothetical protein
MAIVPTHFLLAVAVAFFVMSEQKCILDLTQIVGHGNAKQSLC